MRECSSPIEICCCRLLFKNKHLVAITPLGCVVLSWLNESCIAEIRELTVAMWLYFIATSVRTLKHMQWRVCC